MTALTPCLWFDNNLEEAAEFYAKVFPNSSVDGIHRMPDGTVMGGEFTIAGMKFRAINGGPVHANFNESISLSVSCADQDEVDRYWDALVNDGGEESQCGWLKDKFGLSWQIIPDRLFELFSDPDPARSQAAMGAMMGMQKIVIADLEAAADSA